MESNFVDYVKIMCRSGKGGKGSMHLRHVKYNPNGGPDGGDGGKGGSIILRGNHNYWTLLHLKYERHIFAEHGGNGGRDKCHGTDGKDVYIDVPCGTVVYDAETGKYVCDITYDGQEIVLLKGRKGRTWQLPVPLGNQPGTSLCAARRADAGDDHHPRAEAARGCWTGGLPQCRQIDPRVGAVECQAQDRKLSASPRWNPRWASSAIATASRL